MEQKHVLLSAFSVGVGVGVGLLSSGQSVSKWVKGTNGSPDLISGDQIEYELMRMSVNRENEVSFENFPYYLRWQESLSHFTHIFYLGKQGKHRDVKVYLIPRNHDIGYESNLIHSPEEFGKRNYRFTAGEVEFTAIDALTLDGKREQVTLFCLSII